MTMVTVGGFEVQNLGGMRGQVPLSLCWWKEVQSLPSVQPGNTWGTVGHSGYLACLWWSQLYFACYAIESWIPVSTTVWATGPLQRVLPGSTHYSDVVPTVVVPTVNAIDPMQAELVRSQTRATEGNQRQYYLIATVAISSYIELQWVAKADRQQCSVLETRMM